MTPTTERLLTALLFLAGGLAALAGGLLLLFVLMRVWGG